MNGGKRNSRFPARARRQAPAGTIRAAYIIWKAAVPDAGSRERLGEEVVSLPCQASACRVEPSCLLQAHIVASTIVRAYRCFFVDWRRSGKLPVQHRARVNSPEVAAVC